MATGASSQAAKEARAAAAAGPKAATELRRRRVEVRVRQPRLSSTSATKARKRPPRYLHAVKDRPSFNIRNKRAMAQYTSVDRAVYYCIITRFIFYFFSLWGYRIKHWLTLYKLSIRPQGH